MSDYPTPSIVYDSPDFVVINKPPGLLTHPRNENDHRPSVLSWLLEHYPQAKNVGDPTSLKLRGAGDPPRPGIVHRIDKDTSGLLILAKTQKSFLHFKKLFHDRLISKTYIALVYGDLKNDRGIIDAPLFKFGTRQSTRPVKEGKSLERAAVTEYSVLKRFSDDANPYTLVEVSPKTGRTHQIRIHFKSIGHPVVGDPIYGGQAGKDDYLRLGRFLLHAQKLSLVSPTGQGLFFETDPPDSFQQEITKLNNR